MKYAPFYLSVAAAVALSVAPWPTVAQSDEPEISEAEAENAARSVARYCKTLITRMDDIITDQWATQDLQDLAAVWQSLDCHRVFGVDDRVRWLVR